MKKKLLFFLIALLPAIAAMSQTTAPGFRATYIDGYSISKTFLLDSVISWGSMEDGYVIIKTASHGEIRMQRRYPIKIEYPELKITPPQDYLVVQVNKNEAVFCMEAGLEMTWKGTLDIKGREQSQSICLESVSFSIERRTYGYINPSISTEVIKKSFFC